MSDISSSVARVREARLNQQICTAIREQRLNLGVLQSQLAAHLGLAESTFSRYESGQRTLSAAMLCMISTYLRQPITAFLPPEIELLATPDPQPANETLRHVTHILEQRPDLLPTVLGLLETMIEGTVAPIDERDS